MTPSPRKRDLRGEEDLRDLPCQTGPTKVDPI